MADKPQLITSASGKGEPINYVCSRCGQIFPLADERSPKESCGHTLQPVQEPH
jgi:hypothetical protein